MVVLVASFPAEYLDRKATMDFNFEVFRQSTPRSPGFKALTAKIDKN